MSSPNVAEPKPSAAAQRMRLHRRRKGLRSVRIQLGGTEAAVFHLDCVTTLLAEDFAHGEELERILTPKKPKAKILLRKQPEQSKWSTPA